MYQGGSLRFLPESAPAKKPPEKHLRLEQKWSAFESFEWFLTDIDVLWI